LFCTDEVRRQRQRPGRLPFLRIEGLTKLSGQYTNAASPFLSRSFKSCVEHDVHDPQSESAIMTASQFSAISLIISRGATRVFVGSYTCAS